MPAARLRSRLRGMIPAIARIAVIVVVVLAVLHSAAYVSGSFSTWWLELLLYVPFPAYLAPALAALALSWTLTWLWRLAAALAVVLVVTVIMGLVLGHSDEGSTRVRMMTYNIKAHLAVQHEGGFEAIVREVAQHDPDILVMQDAGELADARAAGSERVAPLFAGRSVYALGQYIVVTRLRMRDCRAGDISYSPRSITPYVRCVVTAGGIDIDLATAHFVSPREGLNAARRERLDGVDDWQQNFADRLAQARRLAGDIVTRQRPLILAGDLNAPEASPVIRTLLAQGLRDAFSSAGWGYGYSHGHALKPRFSFLRIDHILVSPEIGVVDCVAGGREASEHRPVIADLVLQRR